jgi:hypothetical protein
MVMRTHTVSANNQKQPAAPKTEPCRTFLKIQDMLSTRL